MKKKVSDNLTWVFVGNCLLLSVGVGFGVGSLLMLVAAVLALPFQPIRALWKKVLSVKKEEEKPKKRWQRNGKKVQKKLSTIRA